MKNVLLILFTLTVITTFAKNDGLNGEWNGTRYQYDAAKQSYIAEFKYKYTLTQDKESNAVTGTAFIESSAGHFAEIALRGFVDNNKFYFEEYEVLNAKRGENQLWCLKKGVLDIVEKDNKIILQGATPSYAEILGFECSGGVTFLSKEAIQVDNKEIEKIETNAIYNDVSIYPNPFSVQTTIKYINPKNQLVTIDVIDIQGRVLEVIENKELAKGEYQYDFIPKADVNSTYYYVRVVTKEKSISVPVQKLNNTIELR